MRTNEEILNDIVGSKDFSVLSSKKELFIEAAKEWIGRKGEIKDYNIDINDGWNVRMAISYDGDVWGIRFFTIAGEWAASVDKQSATEEEIIDFLN